MIPTGLRFGIPHGYMLQVCNRSSMGAKRSLVVGAHIIDSGYDGEIFVNLPTVSSQTFTHRYNAYTSYLTEEDKNIAKKVK